MRLTTSLMMVILLLSIAIASQRHTIGTAESIIFDILKDNIQASSTYTFKTNDGEDIKTLVQDFYYRDGYLAMNGRAQESEHSEFILKGDKESLYGWIVFKDEGRAYEYTTDDNGAVAVERVPMKMVYSIDDFEPPAGFKYDNAPVHQVSFMAGAPFPPHIGKYPGCDVTKLQSMPGAQKVMYLNISAMMNGDTPKPPQTKEDIWLNWQVVSGGYSAYKVNVTTDPAVYQAAGVQNAGICKFIDQVGRSSCGVNIFGTSGSCTCYRDRGDGRPNGGMWTGDVAWHESGHMMGVLDYGGTPGGTYFEGFPRFKWVPIMGNLWFSIPWKEKALIQWCKGEYNTATTKADFLAIANKKFPYRDDDIPQTVPLKFTGGTQITIENNFGQIAPNTDSDGFTFEIKDTKGHAKLLIDRIESLGSAMLDVDASIVDASGKVMAQHNADSARFALLDVDLPPGKYTLIIKGGAEGTPQTGFSNYGSIGYYGISGEITGGGTKILNFKDLNRSVKISKINTHGRILLEMPQTSKVEKIAVHAMNGTVVYQTQSRVETIDLSRLAAGVYTINIALDGARIVRKVIKN